jgi:hypothetical protein
MILKSRITYLILVLLAFAACKKEEDPKQPEVTQFSFSIPDSVVFEHSQTKSIPVTVMSESNKTFYATFEELPPYAFGHFADDTPIEANQTGNLELDFYQTQAEPGTYTGKVRVSVPNENNAIQYKDIKLIYSPNCLYDFRNHVYGQITFVSNGNPLNKTISCSYNLEGQLEISGLTTYDVVLNADCDNQTVTMIPLINNGFYMTGEGQIQGNEITIQIFSDGELHSNSTIRLQ